MAVMKSTRSIVMLKQCKATFRQYKACSGVGVAFHGSLVMQSMWILIIHAVSICKPC